MGSLADYLFELPDAPGVVVVIHKRTWNGPQIVYEGRVLPREKRGGPYILTQPDGNERLLEVRGTLNMSLTVGGRTYPLERPLRGYEYLLMGLPVILAIPVFAGGALGTGFTLGAILMNARAARLDLPALPRALAMVGVTLAFLVLYFVIAVILLTVIGPRSTAGN